MVRFLASKAIIFALPLTLMACGGKDDAANLAELDAQLTNNASDPALRGALEDRLASDPDLAEQSNARAVRPVDGPADGAVPVMPGNAKLALVEAQRLAGGRLQSVPMPAQGDVCADCTAAHPVTLGALARKQGKGACNAPLAYDMGWATKFPDAFPIYPGARLMEAAGADAGRCRLRAARFVSDLPMQGIMDFYYTMALRAGYSAEHRIMDGAHVLGGTQVKGDGGYFITFANAPGGGTTVDLIASNGR